MLNNIFFIVCREKDHQFHDKKPNRDQWGWELVDNIERTDYSFARKEMQEYQKAMPNHIVRIRAIPIKVS